MAKLEELQKEIRSKIPRLMEVERGLLFYGYKDTIYVLDHVDERSTFKSTSLDGQWCISSNIRSFKDKYEIIGKDILLSDVRDWIYVIEKPLLSDKVLTIIKDKVLMKVFKIWKGDYLKDQSQELIDYLHSLIKK